MSSSQLNMSTYSKTLSSLAGGRKRRASKIRKSKRYSRRHRYQKPSLSTEQNGGFFPGIGEVVSQAIVPFGLYAAQHKFKSSSRKVPANYSFKKLKKFKFTRRV